MSKANNGALWRPEKSQFSAVLCTSNTLCMAWFLEYRLYSPKINIYTKLWSVVESYAHITEITTVLRRIKRNLGSFASVAGVKRISTYLFTFITRPFFPSTPKSRGNGSNGGVEASSRSRRRGLMFRRCILAECFLVFYGNSRSEHEFASKVMRSRAIFLSIIPHVFQRIDSAPSVRWDFNVFCTSLSIMRESGL